MSFAINQINGNRPQPPMGGKPPAEITSALQAAGATAAEIAAINGPQAAQALAAKYSVTLPEPPQRQEGSIFGQDSNGQGPSQIKAKVDSQLTAAGATADELSAAQANGFDGIKALAEKYGVTLPQPPQRPDGDGNRPDSSQMKAKIDSLLKAGGATDAEISGITGPQDVKTLADKYGVDLPQPPQKKSQGQVSSGTTQSAGISQILNMLMSLLGGGLTNSTETADTSSQNSALLLSLMNSLGSGNSILA